jgi:hypothetical protein
MTDQAMSPLRRRMIEDMTIRKFAPKTRHDYLKSPPFSAITGLGVDGAQERTRTFTAVKPLAPEASASTNSTTWARAG